MIHTGSLVSLLLYAAVAALVVASGLKKIPGRGVIFALVIATAVTALRPGGLEQVGLFPPENWQAALLWGFISGCLYSLLSIAVIEPLVERFTGEPHDTSLLESARGSLKYLLLWIVVIWLLVAVTEEAIFRGFLMSEFRRFAGDSPLALVLNVALSSAVFGLAHAYQGRSGIVSTAIAGVLLGIQYAASGYNLWLPIITHGFVDTVAFALMFASLDRRLKRAVFKDARENART